MRSIILHTDRRKQEVSEWNSFSKEHFKWYFYEKRWAILFEMEFQIVKTIKKEEL